jgi:uncharacterized membrane protein YfcA
MLSYLLIILVGLVAGTLGAIIGVGGAVVMLPASEFLMNLSTVDSIGTTLFAVMFTALSGGWAHYRQGNVNVSWGLRVGLGGLLGVVLGSYLFKEYLSTQEHLLTLMLAVLFAFLTIRMAKDTWQEIKNRDSGQNQTSSKAPLWTMPIVGLVVGCLTGVLGLGGGFLIVPAMIWLYGAPPYLAVGTTLLAILPITAVGAFAKLSQGFVVLPIALLMGVGTLIGTQLGAPVTRFIKPAVFKGIFTMLFILLTISYLASSLAY